MRASLPRRSLGEDGEETQTCPPEREARRRMNSPRSAYVTSQRTPAWSKEEKRMTVKACWESVKVEGANVLDKLQALIREGNVRRVVVSQRGRTVAEFPL